MFRKIECYIQPSKIDQVKDALIEAGVDGMIVSEVEGFSHQRGHTNGEVPNKEVKFLPKTKLEIIVDEDIVDKVTTLIVRLARTGKIAGQARGFIHFSLGKRAKSESVDASSQPCSMARAARCASVTRLATA